MIAWMAVGLTAEMTLFVVAGVVWYRSRAYTLAEAVAAAVMTVFLVLSLTHQISLLIGSAIPGYVVDILGLAVSMRLVARGVPQLSSAVTSAVGLLRREPLSGSIVACVCLAMAGLVAVGWGRLGVVSVGHPWLNLSKTLPNAGFLGHILANPLPPLNASALFFHTTRFGLPPGACGIGLLAYMAVGCCTYTLARRYAWPPMALTVTLMVMSMPRLVVLERWPTPELVSATAIAFSLVLIYRLLELHRPYDLRLFLLCVLFSIRGAPESIALALVMVLLLMVMMIRRHGWLRLREMVGTTPWLGLATLLPAVIMSPIVIVALNRAHGYPLLGGSVTLANDGLMGALANLMGYLFISADVTEPVQRMTQWLIGLDLDRLLNGVFGMLMEPLITRIGTHDAITPTLSGKGVMGFGPAALLLVLPAMTHAIVRGPRRLKAIGIAWMGYLYVAALTVGWRADSLSVLTPLYAANAFVVAYFMPPWRLRRRGMRLLQVLFALLLAWSLTCN